MENKELTELQRLVLAPYFQKATALIGHQRRVGGNQFRHAVATFGILIDYHYTQAVLLKASLIHDLFEDIPETDPEEIARIDSDGAQVVKLVQEVSRRAHELKIEYLSRVRDQGSKRAKILKVADRISNLTDLHTGIFSRHFIQKYIDETAEYVLPIACEVNQDMAKEIQDLLGRRRKSLSEEDIQEVG